MTALNWPTFVLQRRINQPLGAVERLLCDPMLLRAGVALGLGIDETSVSLDKSFGVTFPPFGVDGASWWAPASILTRRGRTTMTFDLEINEWDTGSTELLVRPRHGRPDRWSGRRMRKYFLLAHATADAFTQLLSAQSAVHSAPTTSRPAAERVR